MPEEQGFFPSITRRRVKDLFRNFLVLHMRWLAEIIYIIFGLFSMLIFVISLLLVFPVYFVVFTFWSKKKAPHVAHRLSRLWARFLFTALPVRVRISGAEKIEKDRTYVFVANHASQLDIPAYALSCRNTMRFLAKAELTKIPIMGYVIKRLYLSVDRADKTDRSKSMQSMLNSLEEGISVFLCPEGTRNRTQQPLLDFRDGAFRLAIEAQVPVAVLTVTGARERNSPKNPVSLRPGIIRAEWNGVIETKGMTEKDVPVLKQKAYSLMLQKITEHRAKK